MLWEFYQQGRIRDAVRGAAQAEAKSLTAHQLAMAQQRRLDALERENERLVLTVCALVELLQERFHLPEAEIEARMQQIDLRDGVADGRFTPPKPECTGCGRTNHPGRAACLWCGNPMELNSPLP